MAYQFLLTRRDGAVEYVTLNRPDVRNAFNEVVIRELTDWAATVTLGGGVRVAVLAGAGSVFCAGADLTWMARMAAYTHDENVRDASAAAAMYAALGGGAGLAAVCDVVVADTQTVFGFTEVKLGLAPAVISPYVVAKIGVSAARELFLTGIQIDAERARAIGLVHTTGIADQLDAIVALYVQEMLAAGPEAIAAAKALIRTVASRRPEDVMALTAETIAERRASAEGQEGLKAFLEKRKPRWARESEA